MNTVVKADTKYSWEIENSKDIYAGLADVTEIKYEKCFV